MEKSDPTIRKVHDLALTMLQQAPVIFKKNIQNQSLFRLHRLIFPQSTLRSSFISYVGRISGIITIGVQNHMTSLNPRWIILNTSRAFANALSLPLTGKTSGITANRRTGEKQALTGKSGLIRTVRIVNAAISFI